MCIAEFSPCWALPEYIRALIHLACLRVYSVTPWAIVYRLYRVRRQGQSDWFLKITSDPLRMMEYRVSRTSAASITTAFTRHQLSIDIFFSFLSMKYDIKIQNAAIWRFLRKTILHSKSRTQCFLKEEIFFLAFCLSKRYTKVPEVVSSTSL